MRKQWEERTVTLGRGSEVLGLGQDSTGKPLDIPGLIVDLYKAELRMPASGAVCKQPGGASNWKC